MRAKNATEILETATLVTWQSFNGSYADSGPNGINGIGVNVSLVPGRVDQALSFTSNTSYYQVFIFTETSKIRGENNHAKSFPR